MTFAVPESTDRVRPDRAQEEWVDAACASIRAERLQQLAVGMTSIASPTGEELPLARYLADELAAAGANGRVQPLDDTQANAVGVLEGDGSGADLLLYAPIDTLTTGAEAEDVPWIGPGLRDDMTATATVAGPYVSGLGASNPKGHGACVVAAVEAIRAAGVPLRGSLLAGFGAGGMPTNGRAGHPHTGHGVGCSFMVEQGVGPDAAIIAKPGWTVSWEEVGLIWMEVRVHGTHTYVGSRHRLAFRNPIVDAATVITDLEAWFEEYTAGHTDGTVAPQAIIGAVEGGWWRMAAVTPALCRLLVDLRVSPRTSPAQVRQEFSEAIARLRSRHLDLDWEPVVIIPGTATDVDEFVVSAAVEAWEHVEGRTHEVILGNSGATDANILRSHGIPTVRIGMPKVQDLPGPVDFELGMNTVDVREMERLTRHLVRVAVNYCTRPRAEVLGA